MVIALDSAVLTVRNIPFLEVSLEAPECKTFLEKGNSDQSIVIRKWLDCRSRDKRKIRMVRIEKQVDLR